MDNRRLVKWFDIRHHEKYEPFVKVIKPRLGKRLRALTVWARKPNGETESVGQYQRDNVNSPWRVQVGNTDETKRICPYFEDPENITEEEWGLFQMCEPELVSWLGKNTLAATDIELMLKGRVMLEVE